MAVTSTGAMPPGKVRLEVVMLARLCPSKVTVRPTLPRFMGRLPRGFFRWAPARTVTVVEELMKTPTLVMLTIPGTRY